MILVSTVYKSQWTVDFVSAIPAGLARAVMLYVWAEVRAPIMEFASVILSKAGEETFAKFLDVQVLVRIVRVMVTVTALHTSAHVTRDGLVWDAIFLIVQGRQTAITAATVMRLLLPHNVRTAVEAGWELHVLILVRLESKLQWTVDSVFVGLDTQVLGVTASAPNTVRLSTTVVSVISGGEEISVIIQAALVWAQTVRATEYVTPQRIFALATKAGLVKAVKFQTVQGPLIALNEDFATLL